MHRRKYHTFSTHLVQYRAFVISQNADNRE
jgi:hypothetical protein